MYNVRWYVQYSEQEHTMGDCFTRDWVWKKRSKISAESATTFRVIRLWPSCTPRFCIFWGMVLNCIFTVWVPFSRKICWCQEGRSFDTEICGCGRADADHRQRVYQENRCLCHRQVRRQAAAESEDILQLRGRCENSRYFRADYRTNNLWTQKNGVPLAVTPSSAKVQDKIVTCRY